MPIGKGLYKKRHKRVSQDAFNVEFFFHNSGENQDLRGAPFGYPSPHMNFVGMLNPWFQLGRHAFLPETDLVVPLQPNTGLVGEDHVIESLPRFLQPLAKRQTSYAVGLSDCLAVFRAVLSPTKFPTDPLYSRD